jgi:hypothetical protein
LASQNPERPLGEVACAFPTAPDWLAAIDELPARVKALTDQAERCRRLAEATFSREVSDMLGDMAEDYELKAEELRRRL